LKKKKKKKKYIYIYICIIKSIIISKLIIIIIIIIIKTYKTLRLLRFPIVSGIRDIWLSNKYLYLTYI